MWSYILKRLLLMIPTLLGVLTLTFVVIQFVPGGPVEQMQHELRKGAENGAPFGLRTHTGVDAQQIAQLKVLYGFDKPPLERYVLMLKRFSTFDLGQSYFRHQSVWSLIVSKLPVSISIGLWTFFLTYLISVPLGIAKAVRNGSRFDIATSLVVLIGYAIPGFVLGVLLLVLFGGGSFLQALPAAQSHLGQLGAVECRRQDRRLPVAYHPADHGLRGGQFRRRHDADEKRLPRRDPQAIRADRPCQRFVREARAVEACVS